MKGKECPNSEQHEKYASNAALSKLEKVEQPRLKHENGIARVVRASVQNMLAEVLKVRLAFVVGRQDQEIGAMAIALD